MTTNGFKVRKSVICIFTVYVLFFFIALPGSGNNKENEIKILKQKLISSLEIEKSILLNKIAKLYWLDSDPSLPLKYSGEAVQYALKFKQESEMVYAFINMSHAYRRMKQFEKAEIYIKKAEKIAKKRKNKKEMLDVYITYEKIFEFMLPKPDLKKILKYSKKLVSLSESLKDWKTGALYNHILGGIYLRFNKKQKSLKHYHRALDLYYKTSNYDRVVHILTYLASSKRKEFKFSQALEYLRRAETIAKEKFLEEKLCRVYSGFGSLFYYQGKFLKSFNYYIKENKIAKKIKNTHWEFGSTVYLIDIQIILNKESILNKELFERAEEILEKKKYLMSRDYYNVYLLNKAKINWKNENSEKIYRKYLKSVSFAKKNNNLEVLFRTYLDLIEFYRDNHSKSKCKLALSNAKKLNKKIKNVYFKKKFEKTRLIKCSTLK